MTKEIINIKQERDKVDGYIITANITVIAAFIIILSIKKPEIIYISYASIASLFGLIASLLFSLWHKYRLPKRQLLFEQEKEKLISDMGGDIADFAETFVLPTSILKVKEQISSGQIVTKEEIKGIVANEKDKDKIKKVIVTHLEKLNFQLRDSHEKIFNKPLNEKNAKTKFYIDKASKSFRHGLFVVGIIFFFLAIILKLTLN